MRRLGAAHVAVMTIPQDPNVHPKDSTSGRYTEKSQSAPEVTNLFAVPIPEHEVKNSDLEDGDVIIGENGKGRMRVTNIAHSNVIRGFMTFDCDYGVIFLDADESSLVAATDEEHFDFTADSITDVELSDVFQAGKRNLGIQGTYFSRADIVDEVESWLENQDEDSDLGDDDIDVDKVWDAVRDGSTWQHLDDTINERVSEQISDIVADAIRLQTQ